MKTLLTLFVLFFSSSVVADDIKDFEIEGIQIGDSLLDYVFEEEILKYFEITSSHYQYLNNPKKYGEVYILNGQNFKTYRNLSFFVKPDDKHYIIYSIRCMLDYIENLDGCLEKQEEIDNEIENFLNEFDKHEATFKSELDPSKKSNSFSTKFILKNGDIIETRCNNWEENLRQENNWTEGLSVKLTTSEVDNWLSDY